MSLLFVDGWDLYSTSADVTRLWNAQSSTSITTSAPTPRTGRACLSCPGTSAYLTYIAPAAGEHATWIVGTAIYRAAAGDTEIVRFKSDANTTSHVCLCVNGSGFAQIRQVNHIGTSLGVASTGAIPINAWHYIEVKMTLGDAPSGAAVVNVDGVQVLNLTGIDTKNGGTKTVFDSMFFGGPDSTTGGTFFDDTYLCNAAGTVNNTFLGDCKVRTLYPNGNGANSAGVGSDSNSVNNYQLVQDTTPTTGTATYVDLVNTNDEDTYTFDDLPDLSGTVAAVQLSTYADKTDSGARAMAQVTRIGGTDYASADLTLGTSFGWQTTVRETSPATSVAFTRAEVNGAEYGVRAR